MHRRKTQYRKRNNAYYLKRGETIRGPLERAAILQAATGNLIVVVIVRMVIIVSEYCLVGNSTGRIG